MCTRFIWPPKQLDDDDDRCSPHGRPQASEALCVLQADSPPNLEQPGNYEQHPVHSVLLVNWLCAVALAPRGSEPGRCLSVAYVTGIEARDGTGRPPPGGVDVDYPHPLGKEHTELVPCCM